jgi:dienelactone hydrolase
MRKWLALPLAATLSLPAPSAVAVAGAPAGGLQLAVSPKLSAPDARVSIRVSGLRPGASLTLTVTSVDAAGIKWSSTSMYTATSAGTVDPAAVPATATYSGTDPMGPIDFMNAAPVPSRLAAIWPFGLPSAWTVNSTEAQPMYSWAECPLDLQAQHGCTWSKPLRFTFTATSGQARASVTVQRGPPGPVTARFESVAATGFYGVLWQPPAGRDNHIGVVEFPGAEGGINNPVGALLALHGYSSLDLAYFGVPGIQKPRTVSLDYFAKALRWLGAQPGVDPRHLWVMGWSLGSEAAFLLGAHFPGLVHGVVALAPYQVATCQDDGAPIWSLGGKLLPCTKQYVPHPTDDPGAVVPVAEIHGPVFLDCPGADDSGTCAQAAAVMAELAAAHDSYPHQVVSYPGAGHGIGMLLPYYPGIVPLETAANWQIYGLSDVANPLARADQWPKLLGFLRN